MKTSILRGPKQEPITVAEAKSFLKITHNQEDDLFLPLIKTARNLAETYTRRKFITQRLMSILPFSPNHKKKEGLQRVWVAGDYFALFLPRGPLQKIIEVERVSEEGKSTPISYYGYHVNQDQDPALLMIRDRHGWGVRLTYDAGYGESADQVPDVLRHAILKMVVQLYQKRDVLESQLIRGVADLLNPYRLPGGIL